MLEGERGSGRGQQQRHYGRACTVGEGRLDRPGRIGVTPGKTWGESRGRALALEGSLSWEGSTMDGLTVRPGQTSASVSSEDLAKA